LFVICNCSLYEYRGAPVGRSIWVIGEAEVIPGNGEVGFGCNVRFAN